MANMNKQLYRLPKEGKIFGVCAGLASYFDIDVTLMRVVFVLLTFATGGAMIFVYIVLAIVMPVAGSNDDTIDEKIHQLGHDLKDSRAILRTRNYLGISLMIVGVWLLLGQFYPWMFNFRWDYIWPILLVIAGLMIIVRSDNAKR